MTAARRNWIWIVVAVAAVIAILAVVAVASTEFSAAEISAAGWGAMVLGVVVTLALGFGLMSLVFISNRRGYDDPGGPWA